ncbi:POK9 protein, partial [Myiagra hebetior]|nr:POK9 protein [Myiagra hebetior]
SNADCKKLLKLLPNPEPTLVEMTEACNRIGSIEHKYENMAAAFAAMKSPSDKAVACYSCGQPGHLKKDCFQAKGNSTKPFTAPGICPRC